MSSGNPIHCRWTFTKINANGEVVSEHIDSNLVVNTGRQLIYETLLGLAGSSLPIVSLGFGASSTAATQTQTQLVSEFIGNSKRLPLTNTSGAPLSTSDIQIVTNVISGITYFAQLTLMGTITSSDSNPAGSLVQELGLFNTTTLPGTPTGSSGVMFDRIVDTLPSSIEPANSIQYKIEIFI